MSDRPLIRLTPIDHGTVLDHLPVGTARKILEILRLDHSQGAITLAVNTESKTRGRKDLLFIENRELTGLEVEKIGLIATGATWNTIRNKSVVEKRKIELPSAVEGILVCNNPACITNHESISTKFAVFPNPLKAKCFYCEKILNGADIVLAVK